MKDKKTCCKSYVKIYSLKNNLTGPYRVKVVINTISTEYKRKGCLKHGKDMAQVTKTLDQIN